MDFPRPITPDSGTGFCTEGVIGYKFGDSYLDKPNYLPCFPLRKENLVSRREEAEEAQAVLDSDDDDALAHLGREGIR